MPVTRRTVGRLVRILNGEHKGEIGVCVSFSPAGSNKVSYHIILEKGFKDVRDSRYELKKLQPLDRCYK